MFLWICLPQLFMGFFFSKHQRFCGLYYYWCLFWLTSIYERIMYQWFLLKFTTTLLIFIMGKMKVISFVAHQYLFFGSLDMPSKKDTIWKLRVKKNGLIVWRILIKERLIGILRVRTSKNWFIEKRTFFMNPSWELRGV